MSATKTEAVVFERPGDPAEVLSILPIPLNPFTPAAARVRLLYSPINPADLNYIEGTYGVKPQPPAVGGLEGVGEVVEAGSEAGLAPGTLVSLPRIEGHWRREWVGPAVELSPFPDGLTPIQAALFRINPATAWCLLHEFVALVPGDWIVQNAATSEVGRAVIALARHLGLRTLNLVRRASDIPKLEALGATRVVVAEEADPAALKSSLGASVSLGLNAVGGESAALVAKLLTPGATHVTYGAMARQPLRIGNGALIFDDLRFHGFWVTRWRQDAPAAKVAAMEQTLAAFFQGGLLKTEVDSEFALPDFSAAIARAGEPGRNGKVVFKIA